MVNDLLEMNAKEFADFKLLYYARTTDYLDRIG